MPEVPSKRKSVWVYFKLDGDNLASLEEFAVRWELSERIEERGIGEYEGSGSGGGWMDFSFGVPDIEAVAATMQALRDLLANYGVPEHLVRIGVRSQTDEICEELPDFHPGDCLTFQFEDGEYGAAIVLGRNQLTPSESEMSPQTGRPPMTVESIEILVGVLDYKQANRPYAEVFEQVQWLYNIHESRIGQPYMVWLHCFGGNDIQIVHHVSIHNSDPTACNFHLSWELLAEYVIREKYRGDCEHNPYEFAREVKEKNKPNFKPGDCLCFQFDDGDYGAAIVLKQADEYSLHETDTLVGILNYKDIIQPPLAIFEERVWLLDTQSWRRGQPYLLWADYCWAPECLGIGLELLGQISLKPDESTTCLLGLFWEDIPAFVQHEMDRQNGHS